MLVIRRYCVLLYKHTAPDVQLIIARGLTLAEAQLRMRQLANPRYWVMNRRPNVHTFGEDLVLTMRREV